MPRSLFVLRFTKPGILQTVVFVYVKRSKWIFWSLTRRELVDFKYFSANNCRRKGECFRKTVRDALHLSRLTELIRDAETNRKTCRARPDEESEPLEIINSQTDFHVIGKKKKKESYAFVIRLPIEFMKRANIRRLNKRLCRVTSEERVKRTNTCSIL